MGNGLLAIGAGIAVLTGIGAGVSMGLATGEAVARQPEAAGNIRSTMMLGLVLAESTAIYGFVIALMIMFLLK